MGSPATDRWVVNASPLICLGRINRIGWLQRLAREVVIPSGVADEIKGGPADDPARRWVEGAGAGLIKGDVVTNPAISPWDLGRGESEVLSWALERVGFTAILDDRAARRCADVLELPLCGSLGIALLAKMRGHEPKLAPVLVELEAAGLYVSPAVRVAALRLAGE